MERKSLAKPEANGTVVLNLPNAVNLFNTVPHGCIDPNNKIISLLWLHHNSNFATFINHHVNILYAEYLT